jgi:5-methylcytosine-specific restriction endonuclease McrA
MKTCTINGCGKPAKARGFCGAHWARWKRNGNPNVTHRPTLGQGKDPVLAKEAKHRYRDRNREDLRAKGREYSAKNRAKSAENKRLAKAKDPEKYQLLSRAYYESHKAQTIQRGREWRRRNPDRARANVKRRRDRLGGGRHHLPEGVWDALLRKFDHCCAYCGERKRLEQDHVIPLSKGGKHDPANVVPACQSCNRSKGTKLLGVWKGPWKLRDLDLVPNRNKP